MDAKEYEKVLDGLNQGLASGEYLIADSGASLEKEKTDLLLEYSL